MRLQIVMPGAGQGAMSVYLVALLNYTYSAGVGHSIGIQNPRGSDLVAVRTAGLDAALSENPTHILWIDSDIIFPPDLALTLASHDLDVVGCNVIVKDMTGNFYATNSHIPDPSGASQISSLGKSGIEKVKRVGLGVMMTKADVYNRISFPWFGHRWYYKSGKDWLPADFDTHVENDAARPLSDNWRSSFEDWWLCERFERAGIDVHIDHTLSCRVAHLGQVAFCAEGIGLA